ncbi:MAG: hypothetical protein Kow0081_0730 [Candidatus Dojkabacteria bacterium]
MNCRQNLEGAKSPLTEILALVSVFNIVETDISVEEALDNLTKQTIDILIHNGVISKEIKNIVELTT